MSLWCFGHNEKIEKLRKLFRLESCSWNISSREILINRQCRRLSPHCRCFVGPMRSLRRRSSQRWRRLSRPGGAADGACVHPAGRSLTHARCLRDD